MSKPMTSSVYQVLYFFLIFLSFSRIGEAKERMKSHCEKGFYAISSLQFHLRNLRIQEGGKPFDEETIVFNDREIDTLWMRALSHLSSFPQIEEAQLYYYQAKSQIDAQLASKLYTKSHHLLKTIWKKLDAHLIGKEPFTQVLPKTSLARFVQEPPPVNHVDINETLNDGRPLEEKIMPHLIPQDHPLKPALDAIFKKPGAIQNANRFANAGFITLFTRNFHLIVAEHPDLPGYLLKLYFDSGTQGKFGKPGWTWLVNRCRGADNIRQLIKAKNIRHFSVPDKWLYLLPTSGDKKWDFGKNDNPMVLLVTKMDIVNRSESAAAWKTLVTREHIDELYLLLSHGFAPFYLVDNICYTKSGKFCFIDTEHPKREPKYNKIKGALSPEMYTYLEKLVKTGGNPQQVQP